MIPKQNMNDMGPYFSMLIRLGLGMFLSIFTGFGIGLLLYKYCIDHIAVLLLGIGLGLMMGFTYLFKEIQKTIMGGQNGH